MVYYQATNSHHWKDFWAEFETFLGFSPHEPSMWPPLSMRILTSERAFFGFASTWHRPVSKLLAITPMCFGKLGTCFLEAGDGRCALLLWPTTSLPCVSTRAHCLLDRCFFWFFFSYLSTLTAGICVYTLKLLVELKDAAEALEWGRPGRRRLCGHRNGRQADGRGGGRLSTG